MTFQAKNLIAGEWIGAGDAAPDINPSNIDDVVGEYARADGPRPRRRSTAAHEAFKAWSRATPRSAPTCSTASATEILARKDELGRLLSREEGKTLPRASARAVRAGQHLQVLRRRGACVSAARRSPSVRAGVEVEITREPEGVVGIITPWNFPIAIPAWKIAPALAYGNCVVFKPADLVPDCAWALAEIIARAGIAGRRLQPGDGPGLARSATPSWRIAEGHGGELHRAPSPPAAVAADPASPPPDAKVQLEMGGKNPLWCWTTPISASRWTAPSTAPSSPPASAARRRAGSSCTAGIHDRFVDAVGRSA